MITARHIKDRLATEKDPIKYIDGEVARCVSQMATECESVRGTLSGYGQRAGDDDPVDMHKLKEDLVKMGELYYEINLYIKARKEEIKHQKRSQQVKKALAKNSRPE